MTRAAADEPAVRSLACECEELPKSKRPCEPCSDAARSARVEANAATDRVVAGSRPTMNLHRLPARRVLCPGTGKPPEPSSASVLIPTCPDCGKEFGGQGRKWAAKPNVWTAGCPRHYENRSSATTPPPVRVIRLAEKGRSELDREHRRRASFRFAAEAAELGGHVVAMATDPIPQPPDGVGRCATRAAHFARLALGASS